MTGMKIWNGCKKTVYVILFAVLLPVSAYIFYGALDVLEYAEALQGVLHGKRVTVFLLTAAFLLCLFLAGIFGKVSEYLERHQKKTVPVLFGILVVFQLLMILTVRTSFRHDHLKVFDTAVALLERGTIADTHFGHYFMKYPNNVPICLFTYGWLKAASFLGIPKAYWMEFMKVINLLFMNLGLFCTFRLVCKYRSRKHGIFLLLLLLVNPLWYLLGQMYYTSTISLAFSMGAITLFDLAREQKILWKKYMQYLCMGMLLAAGYKIRATVIITAAAVLIWAVLRLKNMKVSKEAFSVLAVFLGAGLMLLAYGQAEKQYAGFNPSETGYPPVHWVMMSAQGEGQYNSADDAYTGSFDTRKERTEADLALLKERVCRMGPGGLFTLFRNKLRVAFSDGSDDYYSLFRSMIRTSWVQKYINGGKSDYLSVYVQSYHGMLTGFLFFSFLLRMIRKRTDFLDIFAFHIAGAYLFYLIWEVDRAYSIPFMLMFLLWAVDGMVWLSEWLEQRRENMRPVRLLPWVAGGGILLMAAGVTWIVHRSGMPVREYAVLQDQETSESLLLQEAFTQTFRTGKPFDHADLWVANWDGPANDSVYMLQILQEDGSVEAEGEIIGSAAPCMEAYTVAFEKVLPGREQTYQLRVTLKNPDCAIKTDFLYYQTGAWDMYPEGALYAPKEIPDVDLAFAIYEER